MKYLVVSDIHGDEYYTNYLFDLVNIENPDKIILLGDCITLGNSRARMLDFLNIYKDMLVTIKGNMDMIDEDLLTYYEEIINDSKFVFTHGHILTPLSIECDVFVQGHTHKNALMKTPRGIFFNPGSLAQPRGDTTNSYGIITDEELIIKDKDGLVIKQLSYRK